VVLCFLHWRKAAAGVPLATFLLLYGVFRFIVEFFREPDTHLGFLWWGASMGQLLSLPMIVLGTAGLILISMRKRS
jgi:phosphatidylglycerol:prolipoprotein diacylglycerol transferase